MEKNKLQPFYKTDFLDLYHADCMDIMKQYPDKYFGLAIVDPPYMETFNTDNWVDKSAKNKKYSKDTHILTGYKPTQEYFNELSRISKNQIIWGGNYFTDMLNVSRGWIVWNKNVSGNLFSKAELAWTSFDKITEMFTYTWSGMLQQNMKDKEIKIHPTQKPVDLYDWLIKNYSKQGFKILDTHFGSGSIALAVDKANRLDKMNLHLTACEIDKDYIEASVKRISESIKQQTFSF